jgi:hypothetical protein
MRVVTVITDQNNAGYKNIFKPSIILNNLTLDTLQASSYRSHRNKDQMLEKYLRTVDHDEVILFTDAYDTFLLAGEDEILEKFYKTGKELVFSGEIVCWPNASLASEYPESKSPFRFLNSGGFIGKAGYIRARIMDNLQTPSTLKYYWSNQIYWTEQYLLHQDSIGIDTQCHIFCTMVSTHDIDVGVQFLDNVEKLNGSDSFKDLKAITDFHIENATKKGSFDSKEYSMLKKKWFRENFVIQNKRIFVNETESSPCHIHFNGGSEILASDILEELSLVVTI